jgi:Desulfoferrodoxin
MLRRRFITLALAGTAGAVALPRAAAASEHDARLPNVIFTGDDPGHWKGKESLHVPKVEVHGSRLKITTPHPMSEPHYIVSHSVVLADGRFVGRRTFTWKDQPVSEHRLPEGYHGLVRVTSTCNLHDFWLREVQV